MYKLPLTGDFTEMKVGSGPVTQLALGLDDGYLFAATADGLVAVFDMPLEANQLIPRKYAPTSILCLHGSSRLQTAESRLHALP